MGKQLVDLVEWAYPDAVRPLFHDIIKVALGLIYSTNDENTPNVV